MTARPTMTRVQEIKDEIKRLEDEGACALRDAKRNGTPSDYTATRDARNDRIRALSNALIATRPLMAGFEEDWKKPVKAIGLSHRLEELLRR